MVTTVLPPNEDGPVSSFLQFYDNPRTLVNYQRALQHYLHCFCGEITGSSAVLDDAASVYLSGLHLRNVQSDLMYFAGYLKKTYSPATAALELSIVFLWLDDMQVVIPHRLRKRVTGNLNTRHSIREEADMSKALFRKLYRELPAWQSVLLLVLIGSGMRIGEAMHLRKEHLDWGRERVAVHIPASITKTKTPRTTFLTREAASELKEFLDSRTDSDPRVFPYSAGAASAALRKAADTLGLCPSEGNLRFVHWHMTRKWFLSRFSLFASKDVAEALAGHEGYLSKSYRRYTPREMLIQFKKAEPWLSILPGNL